MRKFYSILASLLFIAQYASAQWPANYEGVMLQAFYWDSYDDTKWTNLTSQADELSKYFDVIWVPNSAYCTDGQSMGYDPVYWFRHNSSFGSLRELKQMIKTYKEKNVSFIGDVILNHRKGLYDWCDFPSETPTIGGTQYNVDWSLNDICKNDDGGFTLSQGYKVTGADDTGDDFSGFRDLDHTGANVQKNCELYLRYLREELGYAGFRLDMVKGYSGEYTKLYNDVAKPEFCVGEYWDGNAGTLINWINSTGKTSAAFDFSLKYVMRDAFGGGNWGALSNKGVAGSPEYSRYAVTFVDNHDTYENQDRLTENVLAANGLILAMPGTPCVFLKHWQRYPNAIGNMILARKACGITNQSSMTEQQALDGGYVIKTQGSKGTVLYICGFPQYDTTGFKLIASGTNFAYFVSDNITVTGLSEKSDEDDDATQFTVYVKADQAPYLYAWTNGGAQILGEWPGQQLQNVATVDGSSFYTYTFTVAPVNIIFHNNKGGSDNQTANITGITHDSYFTYDGSNGYTDVTDTYYVPDPTLLPECVKALEGHIYAYFRGNKDYDKPRAWVWNDSKNFCKSEWPGDLMTKAGYDQNGRTVWLWDFGVATDTNLPTGILFNNGNDSMKTDDFKFQNGGYYDVYGLIGQITTGIEALTVPITSQQAPVYNLQGQRVSDNYRGIVIKNGRKVIMK